MEVHSLFVTRGSQDGKAEKFIPLIKVRDKDRCAISKPEPASQARSCPRSFLPLALLATSG